MSETFGMMDEAYFVSKNVILNWINDLLKVIITTNFSFSFYIIIKVNIVKIE